MALKKMSAYNMGQTATKPDKVNIVLCDINVAES